ncbi:MAG: enoyl-CoA hydratase/isomerase family protein [Casimicrobiaceae bacterium]|nr:enoyl-CoA hydratase/isomerase family protein [Casimicrobiaceae bacterium]
MNDAAKRLEPVLLSERASASGHRIARATLNSPGNLNALSLAMIRELDRALIRWAEDPTIALVWLEGAGERAFCSGGDVVALARLALEHGPEAAVPHAQAFFEHEYRLDYRLHRYPKPVVVWGHGVVMGGGMGLMQGASHRVVTEASRLAMPEITIGLFPDVGGSWFLSRLAPGLGLFLALTGVHLNAADALYAGLADFALASAERERVLERLAAEPWSGEAQEDSSRLTHLLEAAGQGLELPASALEAHHGRIRRIIGRDRLSDIAERLRALTEDPDPWLARAAQNFVRGSPTTAALSYELQQRARYLSLADVFRLEYQAAVGCCAHRDFPEGVRALLIDKDRNPRWQPATLEEVTPGWIEDHLRPRFTGPHPLADLS